MKKLELNNRLTGVAFTAALLAFAIARACGVPVWLDDQIGGDACDIAIAAAAFVLSLDRAIFPRGQENVA